MIIQDQWWPGEMKPIYRIWLFKISGVWEKWSPSTGYDYSGSVMSRWNEANLQDMTIQDQWCPGEMKPINRIWLFSISDVQVKWSQFTGYDYSGTVMYRWNDEQCQSWIIGWVRDCSEISNWGRAIDFDGKSKRTLTFIHYENVRVCINVW